MAVASKHYQTSLTCLLCTLYCYDCTLVYEVQAEEDIRHKSAKWPRVWTECAEMCGVW